MSRIVTDPPALSQQAVYEAIAYNPEPIARDTLAHLFGMKSTDTDADELDLHISNLIRARKIQRASRSLTRFTAMAPLNKVMPLSDIVVARVRGKRLGDKNRYDLALENVDFDLRMTATIAAKTVESHHLRKGERIIVLLDRHRGHELKARFIGRFNKKRVFNLAGRFNREANVFLPLDKRIKTAFYAITTDNTPAEDDIKYHNATIPTHYNPHEPAVHIGEQKWDPDTGVKISDIVSSSYNLHRHHNKPATLEARRMSRKKPNRLLRRDLTREKIMVVDPANAADHDDGFLVDEFPGGFRTLVVLADVPFYVRPGGELDRAARARGFSHYFPDDTFHMLPHKMVETCSLKAGKEKPVIFVEQFRDEDGIIYDTKVGLGIIGAQQQMSYERFQGYMSSDEPGASAYRKLHTLLDINRYREELLIDSPSTDNRFGDAQLMVQAMMINAGTAIDQFLKENNIPHLQRTHAGHINQVAYEAIADEFRALGYDVPALVDDLDIETLNAMVVIADRKGEGDIMREMIVTRLLAPALYSTKDLPHWGLRRDGYSHSTSPIRRYGDILNLRGVHTVYGNIGCALSEQDIENMDKTADQLNQLQIINRNVQSDAQKYHAIKNLYKYEGQPKAATLINIHKGHALSPYGTAGIEIFLLEHQLRRFIRREDIPSDWEISDSGLGITDGVQEITKGSRIRVQIANVQPHRASWSISGLEPTGRTAKALRLKEKGPFGGSINRLSALAAGPR